MGGMTGQVVQRSVAGRLIPLVLGHDRIPVVLAALLTAQAAAVAAAAASGRIPEVVSTLFRALLTL